MSSRLLRAEHGSPLCAGRDTMNPASTATVWMQSEPGAEPNIGAQPVAPALTRNLLLAAVQECNQTERSLVQMGAGEPGSPADQHLRATLRAGMRVSRHFNPDRTGPGQAIALVIRLKMPQNMLRYMRC